MLKSTCLKLPLLYVVMKSLPEAIYTKQKGQLLLSRGSVCLREREYCLFTKASSVAQDIENMFAER